MKKLFILCVAGRNHLIGYPETEGDYVILQNSAVIRHWGTGKGERRGLGKIAEDGPTEHTKLDPCSRSVRFLRINVLMEIECNEQSWEKIIKGKYKGFV